MDWARFLMIFSSFCTKQEVLEGEIVGTMFCLMGLRDLWELFCDPHVVEHGVTASDFQVMAKDEMGVVEDWSMQAPHVKF